MKEFDTILLVAKKKRMSMLLFFLFLSFLVLVARLSYVQLTMGAHFQALADGNRYVTQPIPAPRGKIYDRNGIELAGNKAAFTITYQQQGGGYSNPMLLVASLFPDDALDMNPSALFEAMDPFGEKYPLGIPRKVITDATAKQVAYIREHQAELPGFNVITEPIRMYNNQAGLPRASHVIGYLNSIPAEVWQRNMLTYLPTDLVGWAGVEKSYEQVLRGQNGMLKTEVNKNYVPLKNQVVLTPQKGHDIKLTIDAHLQAATEQALAETVTSLHHNVPTVRTGVAVAIEPKTGNVLAMASYPDYDPNEWIGGMSNKQYQEDFAPGEMNRAMTMNYLPGSTIKMLTALIGLKEHVITPNEIIQDPGDVQVGYNANGQPNFIHSWAAIGPVDLYRALAQSSNVYMIKTFLKLAGYDQSMLPSAVPAFLGKTLPETMAKILHEHEEFGLGRAKTGIDLPYEAESSFEEEGLPSDLAFAAIGQSEKYSVLQLANYVATIANCGVRMKPHVVAQVIDPDGHPEKPVASQVVKTVDFTPQELHEVQRGMEAVTHGDGLFASVFGKYPVNVAGKTGTAETGRDGTENSSFVGYAPYEDPKIAIAVMIPDNEHNSHSFNSVGPIAKVMMNAFFNVK